MKKKKPTNPWSLLLPQHWPVWLLAGLLRLSIYLPRRTQLFLGKIIGRLIQRLSKEVRLTTEVNIDLCFPELTPAEKQRLVRESFESAGISIFETALAWWGSVKKINELVELIGVEHIYRALEKGKGVILIGAHLTSLQIAGRYFSGRQPFTVVYREQKIPVLNYLAQRAYQRHYEHAVVREDIRKLLGLLKENKIIWITPDIDPKHKASVFAPFFGIPAATVVIPARFAEMTGATLIPHAYYRRADGSGYDFWVDPPLENLPTDDIAAATQRVNESLEKLIRKHPEQYYWQYKRFKTRPDGERNPYSKRKLDELT